MDRRNGTGLAGVRRACNGVRVRLFFQPALAIRGSSRRWPSRRYRPQPMIRAVRTRHTGRGWAARLNSRSGALRSPPRTASIHGDKSMTMWNRTLATLLLAVGVVSGAHAQTLRFGLMDDPDALDPTLARTFAGRMVFAALCDKLVDIDASLNIVPQLATEWSWSEDQKTLTMKLRPGVQFHDG